jgi:hypothetical protein
MAESGFGGAGKIFYPGELKPYFQAKKKSTMELLEA